jgi:hypothetical protein
MCWIISVANDNDLNSEEIGISQFNDIDGETLCNMSEADFISRESCHGKFLYSTLQQLKQEQEHLQLDNINKCEWISSMLFRCMTTHRL